MADNNSNDGIIVDGRHFTFGETSPLDEYPHRTWKKDDIRFFTGPSSNLKYWKCLYGGTPGGWEAYYSLGGGATTSTTDLETTIINIINNLPPNTITGIDGESGPPGMDGFDGEDGEDGPPGEDGTDGKKGLPGPPGIDGIDGQDGENGVDGEDAITPQQFFDLFLAYGREDGVGTLAAFGTGGEGTPDFYLRPDTDSTVLTVGTGSPGETWEYEVTRPLQGTLILDLYVYQCLITPQPSTTATITASVTKNTTSILTSPNLDGHSYPGGRVFVTLTNASYAVGDRIGIHIQTTNFSSGVLVMTAHVQCEEITIAANGIIGPPGPPGATGATGAGGPPGATGAAGTNGTNGINAYTTTTANFAQPAISSNVTVSVAQTAWMAVNEIIYITTGGYYQCISIGSGTSVTLQNLGYPGNASATVTITSGSLVTPGGLQGPAGSSGGSGITQLTGDVIAGPGSGSQVATNVNAPDGFTHAGKVITTAITPPGTPTAGKATQYVDNTSKNFCSKDDAGSINHGVRTKASVLHQFLTAIIDDGTISSAQPSFGDISGSLSGLQFGPLTGDVTTASGTFITALQNIPSGTPVGGTLLFSVLGSSPSTPSASIGKVYVDGTSKNLAVKDDAGVIKHGVQTKTSTANQFLTAIADNGAVSAAQPAFTDITGTVSLSQLGNGLALSVLGNASNASSTRADIAVSSGSDFPLREHSGALGFGTLSTAAYGSSSVTYPKLQNTTTGKVLLGRDAGAGQVGEIGIDATLKMTSSVLGLSQPYGWSLTFGGNMNNGIGTALPAYLGIGDQSWSSFSTMAMLAPTASQHQDWSSYVINNGLIGSGVLQVSLVVNSIDQGAIAFFNIGATGGYLSPGLTTVINAGDFIGIKLLPFSGSTITGGTIQIYVVGRFAA